MELTGLLEQLLRYGVGRRKLDDELFSKDKPPARLGVYDVDEEELCHEVIRTPCTIPGCKYIADSLLDYEKHSACHRHACSLCRRTLPSPHLLDLHVQETHDSFFAVMAERKPSYCCYIEECKEKFMNAEERLDHCVKTHKLPKDFRFEQTNQKCKKPKTKKHKENTTMEVDGHSTNTNKKQTFYFNNNKQRSFAKYTGRKFTKSKEEQTPKDVNMDEAMEDLKASLPE